MHSKLRIKIGNVEFEYEGETAFDREAIKDLFSHLEKLTGSGEELAAPLPAQPTAQVGSTSNTKLHTNTIAAKLSVKTASDLAIAAAAHLQISNGKATFTRLELLEDMRSATNYYKKSMAGNLTPTLKTLVTQNRFTQSADDTFSLSGNERPKVENALA